MVIFYRWKKLQFGIIMRQCLEHFLILSWPLWFSRMWLNTGDLTHPHIQQENMVVKQSICHDWRRLCCWWPIRTNNSGDDANWRSHSDGLLNHQTDVFFVGITCRDLKFNGWNSNFGAWFSFKQSLDMLIPPFLEDPTFQVITPKNWRPQLKTNGIIQVNISTCTIYG